MNKTPAVRFIGFAEDWEQRKLGDLLQTLPFKQFLKEPEPDGKYEIIQQGNEPVIGFANGTPCGDYKDVVIFGDHTLSLYKPQHPFFVATDGVRIVKGQQDTDGYYLLSLLERYKPQSEGYKRYYSILADTNCITTYNTSEQEKIGVFFKLLDNLITLHQRKYDKLTNVKKSMLEKMFPKNGSNVPEIRFKGFTDAWKQRKLGELGTITTGSTPSTAIPDYYSDDGIVWVTPTDICENITFESARKLSDLGQQVGRVVPKNTILVTCIASIGKNTMLGNTGSFNQQINGLTPNENECDPYFLLTESALWSAKMKSSAAAGTMQIVNRTEFSELKTWLPSLIEQQAISDFFRQLDHLITLHQRKLEKLEQIKQAMLHKMFV